MTTMHLRFLVASISALGLACAPEVEPDDPIVSGGSAGTAAGSGGSGLSGGTGGSTGGTTSGGKGGSGGTAGASAGRGGTGGSTGGIAGMAGAGGTVGGAGAGGGGGAGAGGSAGTAGQGGTSGSAGATAGSSGSAGQGGSSGASTASKSEGCGKGGRPSGGVVTETGVHIYTFPEEYDGNTPYPLFIGMHAAGNPIEQFRNLTNGSDIEANMVRAFPKSAGNEWNFNNDVDKVTDMYDDLMANYCIDTSRVFSSGHSSGAQMIVQILANAEAAEHMNYKAVAPVAASRYGAIVSPIPVMYIQGENDSVRNSDGADVVARFTDVNGCDTTSMPFEVPTCMSSGTTVNPGCISYQGCSEPTIWCSHNDPQYSNTSHGVPCFAVDAMYEFFMELP
jgi:polyhydroxybutyrate depolymerase